MLKKSLTVIGFTFAIASQAATIDFDSIDNTAGRVSDGPSLDIDGYNFLNDSGGSDSILHWGRAEASNADPDGTTYSHNIGGSTSILSQIGGGSFDLHSLDIGDVFNNGTSQQFALSADVLGGGSLSITFTSDSSRGLETVVLDWEDIVAFRFGDAAGSFIQADNFVVNAVPIPAAAWLFGSALLGLGLVKRRKA